MLRDWARVARTMTEAYNAAGRHTSVELEDGSRAMLDSWGGEELDIVVDGKRIRFEFSEMFGPMAVTKTGAERTLAKPKPFLRAASLWNIQGRRVKDGEAIWHEPKKPVYKHLGGRHWQVIEHGEIGHDW
jgi:hypothetical protein